MKNLILFFCILFSFQLSAQQESRLVKMTPKFKKVLSKFSVTATAGTAAYPTTNISKLTWKDAAKVSLGDLNISYKLNSRFSFGISTMGSLDNKASGFYDAEGQFFTMCNDDDDDEFEDDDDDEFEDDDDDEFEDDDDDDCDEEEFGQNILGTFTFKLSEKVPFFIQAAGGYSFTGKAPAYTALIGYNQEIFAGFGIMAGIRFSDVLHKKPIDAVSIESPTGIKAELGLSWNF